MKTVSLIFAASSLLFLASCGSGSNDGKKGESTKEVVDKYTTTLQTAPDKARKAASALEKRDEAIDKSAEETKP
ncbi:MAG: hypothetical protein WA162_07350 [Thermodesulfobacteriota bacterium]